MVRKPLYQIAEEAGRRCEMKMEIPGQGKVLARYGEDAQAMIHMLYEVGVIRKKCGSSCHG